MEHPNAPVLTSRDIIGNFLLGDDNTLSEDSDFEHMPIADALTKKSEKWKLIQTLQAHFPDGPELDLADIEYMTFGDLAERFDGKAREILNLPEFEGFVADFLRLEGPPCLGAKSTMRLCEVFLSIEALAAWLGLYFTNREIGQIGEIFLYRYGRIHDLFRIWMGIGWGRDHFSPVHEEIMLYLGDWAPRIVNQMPVVEVFLNEAYLYGFLEKMKTEFGARLPPYLANMRQRGDFYRTARLRQLVDALRPQPVSI